MKLHSIVYIVIFISTSIFCSDDYRNNPHNQDSYGYPRKRQKLDEEGYFNTEQFKEDTSKNNPLYKDVIFSQLRRKKIHHTSLILVLHQNPELLNYKDCFGKTFWDCIEDANNPWYDMVLLRNRIVKPVV